MSDPIVVATIPNPPDPVVIPGTMPTDGFDTSLTGAQANILATSTAQRDSLNAKLVAGYGVTYANYALNMHSGNPIPDDQRQPPMPPFAWELAPPDQDGFVWIQRSTTTRVCPQGAAITPNSDFHPPVPVANHISMNWASRPKGPSKGSFVTAGKDDGMDGGFVTPPTVDPTFPDQPPHTYLRLTTAVGPGWWQQQD